MFLSKKNRLIGTIILRTRTLLSFEGVDPGHPQISGYITQYITVAISRVTYHGYLRISSGLCHGYYNNQCHSCTLRGLS